MSGIFFQRAGAWLALWLVCAAPRAVAHVHFAAGIVDTNGNNQPNAGEPLQIVGLNGTGKTFHLLPRPVGQRAGGYYMLDERPRSLFPTDAFSFTALSDGQIELAQPGHARTGAWIWMEIVSVAGPPGASFSFWDADTVSAGSTPTMAFAANAPTGGYKFVISEGFDEADQDPQGHIHNRGWTANRPGDYFVGFRLHDLSTSGPGGGPWHAPSQVYTFHFQAGPSFQPVVQKGPGGAVLTWASQMGISNELGQTGIVFTVQRSTTLAPNGWENLGTVTGTTNATATFTDLTPPAGKAMYRLSYAWFSP